MSETPRARYELNGTRWTVWFEAALIASCWYEEDAERIVTALNHECAATPEQVKGILLPNGKIATQEQVNDLAFFCTVICMRNQWPCNERLADIRKVLKELGYE